MPGSPGPLSWSAKPLILKSFSLLKIRNPVQNNFQFIEWGFKTWAFVNLKGVTCYVSVLSSLLTVIMMMLMIVILMTQMITVMMITMLLLIMIVMKNVNNDDDDVTTMLMIYDDVSLTIWPVQHEFSLIFDSFFRYYVLHRLPNLTFLDSRPVKKAEKREAQRVGAYMKIVAPSLTDLVSYRKLWHWNAFSPIKKI